MITLLATLAFAVGMAVVYVFFRMIGIIVAVACCSLAMSGHCLTIANGTTNAVVLSDVGPSGQSVCCPPGASLTFVYGWSGFADGGASVNLATVNPLVSDSTLLSLASTPGGPVWCVASMPVNPWFWDVSGPLMSGIGVGFTLIGFGWAFRLSRKGAVEF